LKLEKIIRKFAKDAGFEKKQILKFMLGEEVVEAKAAQNVSTQSGRP